MIKTKIFRTFFVFPLAITILTVLEAHACDIKAQSLENPTGSPISIYQMLPRKNLIPEGQAIILPPTGGLSFIDRRLGKSLCERGISVIILNYEQGDTVSDDLGLHDRASKSFLNSLAITFKYSPKPSVLIGSSLGGLYAALAKGLSLTSEDPNMSLIKGQVLTVTGGSLPEILATSQHDSVQEQRALRFKTYHYTSTEEYLSKLYEAVTLDLYKVSNIVSRDQTLFFGSDDDEIVPGNLQRKLWEKLGRPEGDWYTSSHGITIGRVYFFQTDAIGKHIFKVLR